MEEKEITVDYNVVTEMSGHQPNKNVKLVDACKDIFKRCKEGAQQLSVSGIFKEFDTIEELKIILENSVQNGFTLTCYDEDYQG